MQNLVEFLGCKSIYICASATYVKQLLVAWLLYDLVPKQNTGDHALPSRTAI
jgi:hypothetical protein